MKKLILILMAIACLTMITVIAHAAEVTLAWDANDPAPTGYAIFERNNAYGYNYEIPIWPTDGQDHTDTTATIQATDDREHAFVCRAYVSKTALDGSTVIEWSKDSNEITFMPESGIEEPKNLILQAAQYLSMAIEKLAQSVQQLK